MYVSGLGYAYIVLISGPKTYTQNKPIAKLIRKIGKDI